MIWGAEKARQRMKADLATIRSFVTWILIALTVACVLAVAYAIYDWAQSVNWASIWGALAIMAGGVAILTAAILIPIAHFSNRAADREWAQVPARLERIAAAKVPSVTGPVLVPEPIFEPGKPSKEPLETYSWTVRKQDDGRYSVLPFDKNGVELWKQAVIKNIEDPTDAWDIANQGRRALGWRE
jgi:hypothetical protein